MYEKSQTSFITYEHRSQGGDDCCREPKEKQSRQATEIRFLQQDNFVKNRQGKSGGAKKEEELRVSAAFSREEDATGAPATLPCGFSAFC